MTDREMFVATVKDELPRFDRMFEALPGEKADWRPHEKSRSAKELVMTMAMEAGTFEIFLKTGELDFGALPKEKNPSDFSSAPAHFKTELEKGASVAQGMSDQEWDSPAKMGMNGKLDWETTRGHMAWSLLLDLIHHRGQLSVYVRPMGGKVPSIYGPSADSTE